MIHVFVTLFVVLVSVSGAMGKETKPELYKKWHDQCVSGDTRQIDVQIGRFEGRLAGDGGDQLARVYLGAACALRAKASFWGPTKLKYLKKGKALMDEAVEGAPDDPRVRMVRAIGYYKVPKRFGTRSISVRDFEFLIPIVKEPKGRLKLNERQVILHYAARAFEEEGQDGVAGLRELCRDLDPKSYYGQLAK